ncbi:hypothetical protein CsSME_00038895 [Camellia sinensis var. sinensis]
MIRTLVHTSLPYDILSDEEKRKNYDLYAVEKGNPGFDAGNVATREDIHTSQVDQDKMGLTSGQMNGKIWVVDMEVQNHSHFLLEALVAIAHSVSV